jgi:predicted O-methyltransferase YrrM
LDHRLSVRFNDRWFTGQKRRVLAMALDLVPAEGELLEIGCWEGQSTVWLAQAFAPRTVNCFDWWRGSPNDFTFGLAQQRDVRAQFMHNMEVLTDGNYEVHDGDWRATLPPWLAERRVAFAYVDATHTYAEVADCLGLLQEHLWPGGVLAGDDYRLYPDVGRAVRDMLGPRHVAPQDGHGAWFYVG